MVVPRRDINRTFFFPMISDKLIKGVVDINPTNVYTANIVPYSVSDTFKLFTIYGSNGTAISIPKTSVNIAK